MKRRTLLGVIAAFPVLGRAAKAAERVQIGFITTLSGPAGYLGEDIRDGFLLAVKQENGGLGGAPVQVMVEDDGLKPGTAKQIVQRMLQSDHVKLFTGTVFSNVADTMLGDIIDAQAYFLGPNTSPNEYSGKLCDPHYFVTGWDETLHASAGILANVMGKKRLVVMAPNYLTGKQVIAAVKGTFKGEIVAEIYTSLDQTDFSAEIARIRAAQPDALYEFEPGGLGINFLKQFAAAGLVDSIPLVVAAPSLDPRILAAVGDAARNMHVVADWNWDLDNPANKQFVAGFRETFKREPTYYAAHGYDTARMIASGLKATGGAVNDAFGPAVKKADFQSVRGNFRFASNQTPIQDWYQLGVVKGDDGKYVLKTIGKFRPDAGGAYADQCPMKA